MQSLFGECVAKIVLFLWNVHDQKRIERMSERASGIYTHHGDGVLCLR